MTIEDKIRKFIREDLSFSSDQPLGENDSFLAEGIIDSMGAFELAAFVETAFGIKVETAEIVVKNFDSVGQLTAFVRRKLAAVHTAVPVDEGAVAQSAPVRPADPIVTASQQMPHSPL